jgi:pimeloyl-ACP methyl ester carboxylesterase
MAMLNDVLRRRICLPANGVEIAVLDWGGDGPIALLHHANGFGAAVWAPVAKCLRSRFRVVAVDARGHGDSSVPEGSDSYRWENFGSDLAGVARVLAAEHSDDRVALGLGHSFGGTACLTAAASAPDLFERLVLLDPVILPQRPQQAEELGATAMTPGMLLAERARERREIWPSRAAALAKWREKPLFQGWDPRALELYVSECLRDCSDGRVELKCRGEIEATIFESGAAFDPWPHVARVVAPTLVLWAQQGNFQREMHEALARELPDGRMRAFDGGHLMVMEQPDRVAALAAAFTTATPDGAID